MREVAQQLRAVWCVHDLRMEHQPVKPTVVVSEHRERGPLGRGDDSEPRRQAGHAVAMTHPHLLTRAFAPNAIEQPAVTGDIDERAAEFAMVGGLGLAAQLRAHDHLAVADAEDRNALLEHHGGRSRRFAFMHAGGSAGQYKGAGVEVR